MFAPNGSRTTRNNVSVRSRNSLIKQSSNTQSFHGSMNNDYYQTNIVSPSSKGSGQVEFSPLKKISMAPNTTKNSNDYFLKGSDAFVPIWNKKKLVRNTSSNFHSDATHPPAANDKFSTLPQKMKTEPRRQITLESNPTLDIGSIESLQKSTGQLSSLSPKARKREDPATTKNKTSKVIDYYSKEAINTEENDELEFIKESNGKSEATTVAESHRISSVLSNELKWENVKLPADPEYVLQQFASFLSPYEKEEITKFNQVYYLSDIYHKLIARSEQDFDDDKGDYLVVKNDHIRYRYEALEMLGRGSFGQVLKVFDHKRKEYAAVKVIRSPKKFHYQAKIEIKILKYMMENYGADYNIIGLRDYFVFRNHVCLVFDLMDMNLYDLLKKNKYQGFPLTTVRKFAIQVLYALKFLNHHQIVHCDLKPENILLKNPNKTGVKLIDFGSSCFENEKLYTYIQSRFYRSPEIIFGYPYSTKIDMWSFGCLLCELYLGYPIFAGDSERDQLFSMFEVLGLPSKELIAAAPRRSKFFDDTLTILSVPNTKGKIRVPNATPLTGFILPEDDKFLDLVKKCFEYDAEKRFSADQALAHEWIIEGLPPQLQAQHLQFIKNTAPNTEAKPKELPSPKSSSLKSSAPKTYRGEPSTSNNLFTSQDNSKSQSNMRMTFHTQEDKNTGHHNDFDDRTPSGQPKSSLTKKLADIHKDKLNLKSIGKFTDPASKSSSTRNLKSGLFADKEFAHPPSAKKLTMTSISKQNKVSSELQKSSTQRRYETEEGPLKSSLVAWENSKKLNYGGEDKTPKASQQEAQKTKRGSTYYYFTPKATHSVERNSLKPEKEGLSHSHKSSLLPSLKIPANTKKKSQH